MKLLLNEEPLIVLPSLAAHIGLQESIFLQQLHYWLNRSNHEKDGHKWVYNSYKEWQKQFPFWSEKTISRIVKKLEDSGLVICDNFNSLVIDKTKWYRISYEKLSEIEYQKSIERQKGRSTGQSDLSTGHVDHTMQTKCLNQSDKLSVPLPEITTEITTRDFKNVDEKVNSSACTSLNQKQQTAFQFYEQNGFGALASHVAYKVGNWIDDLSEDLVIHAMKLAVENNVLRWNYVEKILLDWSNKKFKTIADVEADQLRFEAQKNQRQKNSNRSKSLGRQELVPEWFSKRNEDNGESLSTGQTIDFEAERQKVLEMLGKGSNDAK
ncbi:DnaD domain protein [Lysinibacillus sphaericus]|uniref:DnaD domain-containing protein n=1 Tax=Lysinibacillus sphaericus TaxID=1421 RepID=UPI0021624A07|nr:DnaD domain protein [Lysinibacillus sphaericus]MCS1382755.1 DnaD domain protein [Lysinibacillus sphaericus]